MIEFAASDFFEILESSWGYTWGILDKSYYKLGCWIFATISVAYLPNVSSCF